MIQRMSKLTFVSTILIAALSGCGGQTAESAPAKEPTSDVDVKFHEPAAAESEETNAEPEKPAADKAEAGKSEAGKSEAGKSEVGKGDTNTKTGGTKKACAGLKQDICQITMGCAWSSKKVCVEQ
jgi:hypothetical protein